jgi:hypothetical protein
MDTWILLSLLLGIVEGGPDRADRTAVLQTLREYHDGLEAVDVRRVLRVLGPTYFIADESTAGRERIGAHLFLTGDKLMAWPRAFLEEAGPYQNTFESVSVSIRGDAAVVITRETGRNRFRRWRNEEAAWFLGRSEGRWRIAALIIRDIQLPAKD